MGEEQVEWTVGDFVPADNDLDRVRKAKEIGRCVVAVGIGKAKGHILIQQRDVHIAGLVEGRELLRCGHRGIGATVGQGPSQNRALGQLARHVVLHVQVLELFGSSQGGRIGRILQVGAAENHPAGINGKGQHGQ